MKSNLSKVGTLPDDALLLKHDVLLLVPFSSATLWRRIKAGSFPCPLQISDRVRAWKLGDVRAWMAKAAQ